MVRFLLKLYERRLMHKLFSFLGESFEYKYVNYQFNGNPHITKFAVEAMLKLTATVPIDKLVLICTELSIKGVSELQASLNQNNLSNVEVQVIKIPDGNNANQFWQIFQSINEQVFDDDLLTFDFTHGFRSFSIIMSTALNFIRRTKPKIQILGVYYGVVHDFKNKTTGTNEMPKDGNIIDIKDFYEINEWAEGVSRLVDQADTSKLVSLAKQSDVHVFKNINDPALLNALTALTNAIRNINVDFIGPEVENSLNILRHKLTDSSPSEKQLLLLVIQKFSQIEPTGDINVIGEHYFKLQLKICKILIDHKFFMQACTVLRELIGSLGIHYDEEKRIIGNYQKGRFYANEFIQMVERNESYKLEWITNDGQNKSIFMKELLNNIQNEESIISNIPKGNDKDRLIKAFKLAPQVKILMEMGLFLDLHEISQPLSNLRNGFDHAWVGQANAKKNVLIGLEENINEIFEKLSEIINSYCIKSKV